MKKQNTAGFTLIEMLVVVLIIGILAAIALPQYKFAVAKSKFSTLKSATKAVAEAEDRYFLLHNKYTGEIEELDVDIPYKSVICNNEQKTQCSYYLDDSQKMRISLNTTGPQTFAYWQIDSSTQIAFVYQHNPRMLWCVPYATSGLSYRICENDGTTWDENWGWVYK